jgi:Xaa-Pro aminopeptidase
MTTQFTTKELDKFKKVQKLAYAAVEHTRQQLKTGMTEKQACQIMKEYLANEGVTDYFHLPFAWFGDRSAFREFSIPLSVKTHQYTKLNLPSFKNPLPHFGLEFMPSNKKLEEGMAVILDVAPCLDGCMSDIGYSFAHGENEVVEQGRKDLIKFRDLILKGANEKKLMSEIYKDCDNLMRELGYDNCHSLYPLGVLGHQLGKLSSMRLPKLNILGFQPQAFAFILGQRVDKLKGKNKTAAIWNYDSEVPLEPGLWAVEPHLGKGDVGVKFEEILVVTDEGAHWLDDDLPHVTSLN